MKNSGIEWVGEIPNNWEIHPLYYYFSEHSLKNTLGQENNLLSLSYGKIIRKDINTNGGLLPQSFNTYNIVADGDIIIRPTDLQNDQHSLRTALANERGIITSAYIALRRKVELNVKYFHYLLHTYDTLKVFYNMGSGVRQGINFDDLSKLNLLEPSLNEQKKISDYLDKKCAEIDGLIEDIKTQIETLEQYKRSLITEAVTKGLDYSVPMKNSGIEWIPEIPQHWEIKKAKYLINCLKKGNGITKEDIVTDGDTPCVRYGEIYTKYNNSFKECLTRTNIEKNKSPVFFEYGDILFVCTGELIEEIGKNIVYLGKEKCLAGGDIIIMKHNQNPRFLNYAMNCIIAQTQKSLGKAKLKVVHISAYEIGNVFVAVPDIEEQERIADFLDKKCNIADKLISDKQAQIEALESYKKSLIYEYVTGKKEVV